MQTPFSCSYVIAYHHSHRNFKLLKENLNQILRDPRIQVIIVETGHRSHLMDQDMRARVVFVESDTYNLGWMFNIGLKHTSTDNIFFADNSFHPRLEVLHSIVEGYGDRHCIYAQDKIAIMTKEQTDNRKPQMDLQTSDTEDKGIIFYTREGLRMCGGFDENVINDDFWKLQNNRNKTLLNIGKVNGNTLVIFDTDKPEISEEFVEYSKKHLEKISKLDVQQIINYMKVQFKKVGNIRKYEKYEIMNP